MEELIPQNIFSYNLTFFIKATTLKQYIPVLHLAPPRSPHQSHQDSIVILEIGVLIPTWNLCGLTWKGKYGLMEVHAEIILALTYHVLKSSPTDYTPAGIGVK